MKALIFDSGSLISFSMNGILEELKKLKKSFNGKFLITKDVKREVIDKPLTIKRFELEALKIKQLLDEKILEMPDAIGVNDNQINQKTREFIDVANSSFVAHGKEIDIIDSGEASCLALGSILNEKKIETLIAVDERTLRLLVEKPENLKNILEGKLHTGIKLNKQDFNLFKQFKIIRSSELIYVAYKKGFVNLKNGNVLDALLWAMKFKGCSISGDEIREIKSIK